MSGICERGLMLMFKKFGILGALSELLEPHLFGRTGALKFETIGVHPCGMEGGIVTSCTRKYVRLLYLPVIRTKATKNHLVSILFL